MQVKLQDSLTRQSVVIIMERILGAPDDAENEVWRDTPVSSLGYELDALPFCNQDKSWSNLWVPRRHNNWWLDRGSKNFGRALR